MCCGQVKAIVNREEPMAKMSQPNWKFTEMRKQSLRKAQAIARKMRKQAKVAVIDTDSERQRAKNALR